MEFSIIFLSPSPPTDPTIPPTFSGFSFLLYAIIRTVISDKDIDTFPEF